jgi:hypothetical protein
MLPDKSTSRYTAGSTDCAAAGAAPISSTATITLQRARQLPTLASSLGTLIIASLLMMPTLLEFLSVHGGDAP